MTYICSLCFSLQVSSEIDNAYAILKSSDDPQKNPPVGVTSTEAPCRTLAFLACHAWNYSWNQLLTAFCKHQKGYR